MFDRVTESTRLELGEAGYPTRIEESLGADAPATLVTYGNREILELDLLALFSSIRTPPDLILRSLDLARRLRRELPVIGGFQSPLERECLSLLLRGPQPVVVCLARSIEGMRLRRGWRDAIRSGRMLIISPFGASRRPTVRGALIRNRVVAALATRMMVIHARAGSRTYQTVSTSLGWGKPVYCFEHPRNVDLILLGAQPTTADALVNVSG
jgi:predicted Rossmann fold nucleotide-binding protein DprA/Smf involved in DNA uptake